MSSFEFSFIILISMLAGVTVAVALLSVPGLVIYRRRRARERRQEVAELVRKSLADMRNSLSPQQKRVDQGNHDIEDIGHEDGQRNKQSTEEAVSQAQGTVGQDAHQRRATEAEPWAAFHRGTFFDKQGEYDRAVAAYQQVLDSGHPEAAPRAAFNLGLLCNEQSKYDQAVEAYQEVTASKHSEWAPKAVFNLGVLFEERGEYNLAEEAYLRAIASEHPDAASRARLNLGVLFEERGEYDLAEEAYQQAIDSGHPEVAPEGRRNLRGLPMRFPKRTRQG